MIRNALLFACLSLVLVACSHDDNNHHHDDDHTHEDGGHSHDDDAGHEHGDAAHHDGGEHAHDGGGHTHDGGEHSHDGGHPDVSVDTGPEVSEIAKDYCECMLVSCHDEFHARWGESDVEAIRNCGAEISGLPVAGSPQMSGNNVECYLYQCQETQNDATCSDALGDACM